MLSAEENDILTRVGPGTPMGRMMRRFWTPVCTSEQVSADGTPLRASLFGEHFVVFRDTDGAVGVLDELCMHRGVSLALGRNEKGGLRCLYHGWKFCVDGTILDTPNNTNERFRRRLKAPAYPVVEAGGMVWTYVGDPEQQPEFPHFAFMDGPAENRTVLRLNTPANYLQLFEGGVDSSHVGILHSNQANPTWMEDEFTANEGQDFNPGALAVADNAPTLALEDTDVGYHYVARRQGPAAPDGSATQSVRITPVMLPFCRVIPAPAFQFFVFEVPQTDYLTATFIIVHGATPIDRQQIVHIMGLDDPRFWNETDCDFRAGWANGMNQDRAAMAGNWSGFSGIEQEDAVLAVSMGAILDRTKEHMVAADRAVIHLRLRLLESVRLHEDGGSPIGLEPGDVSGIRSVPDTTIAADARWQDLVPGNMGPSVNVAAP